MRHVAVLLFPLLIACPNKPGNGGGDDAGNPAPASSSGPVATSSSSEAGTSRAPPGSSTSGPAPSSAVLPSSSATLSSSTSAGCVATCFLGQSRCDGALLTTCGDENRDGCLDWSTPAACGGGLTCQGGTCVESGALVLFVSTQGNDAWTGRSPVPDGNNGPLATLQGARDRLRVLRASLPSPLPVRVLLRGGVYPVTQPVAFLPEDSGTAAAPVTYAAFPGEEVVLSGGRRVGAWTVANGVWTTTVPAGWTFGALFVDGQRRPRARSPNTGTFHMAGVGSPANQAFHFRPGDVDAWDGVEDAVFIVYHSWATSQLRAQSVDTTQNTVTFTAPSIWDFGMWDPRQRYVVENYPDALDEPGEWYLDRRDSTLRYLPLPGEDPATTVTLAPVATQLLLLQGNAASHSYVQHLAFEGLRFEHTDWQPGPLGFGSGQAAVDLPAVIEVTGGRHVRFERCRVSHVGGYAVWFHQGTQDSEVVACELDDLGGGGVRLGEQHLPSTSDEEASHNRVDNSFIHGTGRQVPDAVGVWIGRSSHNQVTHNEIADTFYSGVSVGWSWGYDPSSASFNTIAHNHIHHVAQQALNDLAGVYTLGVSPGTQVVHNFIHDVISYDATGFGLYADEGTTGVLWADNLVFNTRSGGFHQHYGQDNLVYNNVLALSHGAQVQRSRDENHHSFDLRRNVIAALGRPLYTGSWSQGDTTVDENLLWDSTGPAANGCQPLSAWQALGRDVHSSVADPLFVDPDHLDFRVRADSPAVALGHIPVDGSGMGLYGDAEWVARPGTVSWSTQPLPPWPLPRGDANFVEGFEDTPVGALPRVSTVSEGGGNLRISDVMAASGTRSLALVDHAGLAHTYDPHAAWQVSIPSGRVTLRFALRVGSAGAFLHEWRDWTGNPYVLGPSLAIAADGTLSASGQVLMVVPLEAWLQLEVATTMGNGLYDVTVTLPDGSVHAFPAQGSAAPAMCNLTWVGFISNANAESTSYLDGVSLTME